MSSRPWMPLYVADYLADTAHLTVAESGAYLHLIMHYWLKGGLPTDDERLARIAKLDANAYANAYASGYANGDANGDANADSSPNWTQVKRAVQPFFGPNWTHRRIDEELERVRKVSEKRRAASDSRWHKNDGMQMHTHSHSHSDSNIDTDKSVSIKTELRSSKKKSSPKKVLKRTQLEEDHVPDERDVEAASRAGMSAVTLDLEWQRFRSHHMAKGSLMANWNQAWVTWVTNWKSFGAKQAQPGINGASGSKYDWSKELAELERERNHVDKENRKPH